ncbi:MAG: ABC transporter permease [Nitrospirae bacterium]|nr:ABC transporter permease [Nitrospirota bacterium]MBI3351734.1 ABC transporter permease [Nitrospirota bacterium]
MIKIFFDFSTTLFKNKVTFSGALIIALILTIALLAPFISKEDPAKIDIKNILSPPSREHWMGTDELGRDVYSRIIYASRVSLNVGFVAVGISIVIGVMIGAISGYYGGALDDALMRFTDIMLSIPTFFLILAVIAFLGPNLFNIMLIIGVTTWMGVARLVRAQFLATQEMDYITAARALGANDARIISLHLLPNTLSPVYVSAILGVAGAILVESSLSFLGLGVQPPTPSWGNMLTAGKDNIEIAWWLSFFPGAAILITVLGYNLLGEGLRNMLDPRLKK